MFMVSVKLTRKKMFLCALALVLVIAAGVIWRGYPHDSADVMPVSEQKPQKVDAKKAAAKTNEQRLSFIRHFGWEVEPEPIEVMEVIIPKEFDNVYKEYNSMQKIQGFDLEPFAGKRCKRYSYIVKNYPDHPEDVRLNLIVHKNKVIGGDVCSLTPNGFIHGFTIP